MPGKPELYARLLGTLQAPISGLAGTLKEMVAKFAYAVDAVRVKQEKGASPS